MTATMTRAQFIRVFEQNGGIQLRGIRDAALRSALEGLQDAATSDGLLQSATELDRAFDYIDRVDRNGDRQSFAVHHRALEYFRAMVESNPAARGALDSQVQAALLGADAGVAEGNPPAAASVARTTAGDALATAAERVAASGAHPAGKCYRAVKSAVHDGVGLSLTGVSAYMAAGQLAQSNLFTEVSVPDMNAADLRGWLRTLPRGAVLVFAKSDSHEDGHIGIRTSNAAPNTSGRALNLEASDTLRDVGNPANYGGVRVFVPVDR